MLYFTQKYEGRRDMNVMSFHPEDLVELVGPVASILFAPVLIIVSLLIVRIVLWRKTYVCTECNKAFKPKFMQVHMGWHDGNRRNQYCPHCRKITCCKYDEK